MKKPRFGSWSFVLISVGAAALLASCGDRPETASAAAATEASPPGGVAGLGRIEAGDGIVRVGARGSGGPAIVGKLLVREGERVSQGQVVAELDNKDELEAAVQHAAARTTVARSRLAQARAGAKASDIAAQQAEIERLETDLANGRSEHQRYASLGTNVTAAEIDRLKLRVDSTTRALASARQRLVSLSEVRDVDVAVADAELKEAVRAEARARADARTSIIHAPIDGRVIEVHAWAGEEVGPEGIVEIAPAGPMYAVAEIAEPDIARVKVGQRATVTGDALDKPQQGTVERVSMKVLQNQLMPVNPANFSDSRVVEVWVKLDDGSAVVDRIHLRVNVVIQP